MTSDWNSNCLGVIKDCARWDRHIHTSTNKNCDCKIKLALWPIQCKLDCCGLGWLTKQAQPIYIILTKLYIQSNFKWLGYLTNIKINCLLGKGATKKSSMRGGVNPNITLKKVCKQWKEASIWVSLTQECVILSFDSLGRNFGKLGGGSHLNQQNGAGYNFQCQFLIIMKILFKLF